MTKHSVTQRLERLEQATANISSPEAQTVIIYDPATGQPVASTGKLAAVQIWLPDNGRGDRQTATG